MSTFEAYCVAQTSRLSLSLLYARLCRLGYEIELCYVDAHEAVCEIQSITFYQHRRVLIQANRVLSRELLDLSLSYDVLAASELSVWQGIVSDEQHLALAQCERRLSVLRACGRESLGAVLCDLLSAASVSVSILDSKRVHRCDSVWQLSRLELGCLRYHPFLSVRVSLQGCRQAWVFLEPAIRQALLRSLSLVLPDVQTWVFDVGFVGQAPWRLGQASSALSSGHGFFVQKISLSCA